MHELLLGADVSEAASHASFANYIDPVGLVAATRAGTDRIRSWRPNTEETEIAETADRLAELAAEADQPFGELPRQLVHGDFWDNNVLFRHRELVFVGDFDFMAERRRTDDLALTLYFTSYLQDDPLSLRARRDVAALVRQYDAGTDHPLRATERAALPVALARQPLWSIAMWAANLDNPTTAREHLRGHLPALLHGLGILTSLHQYQDTLT